MNILITGMQRSGTTLLRRIFTIHPEVKKIFHESFFLAKFHTKRALVQGIMDLGVEPKKIIWGEKCPYYPNLRRIKPEVYCERLHEWFPKKFRVVHIVRHPMDIANSNVKKFDYIKSIQHPLSIYKKVVPRIITSFNDMPYVIQIKYERLLREPDIVIPQIYDFCDLQGDINFRERLQNLENENYRKINPKRAFAYKKTKSRMKLEFGDVFDVVNKIEGPNYE